MRAKALTLSQPHATLVDMEKKRLETRSWRTDYRGPLVITASARILPGYLDCLRHPAFIAALGGHVRPDALPLGVGLCLVDLIAIIETECMYKLKTLEFKISGMETQFGDYGPKRWVWVLRYIRHFDKPIRCIGAMGLWDWPDEV